MILTNNDIYNYANNLIMALTIMSRNYLLKLISAYKKIKRLY